MIIDHIGIVVPSIEKGIRHWEEAFGYKQQTEIVTNQRQKVRVVFLTKENSLDVKLIEPSDPTSTIARLSARGGGLHHLCFRCQDIDTTLETLRSKNLRILAAPEPGEAFAMNDIAFLYAQGINIELIDTDQRANIVER